MRMADGGGAEIAGEGICTSFCAINIDAAHFLVQTFLMSKSEKALRKLMSGESDKNITMDEALYVLTRSGFVLDGGKGSHQVYRHPDGRKMVLPVHGKDIKPIYIRQIRKIL